MELRHIIEHRHVPKLYSTIAGHCQAMLFNFENILTNQFIYYYSLNKSLCFPLYFSTKRSQETINSMRVFQNEEYNNLSEFINDYHAKLTDDIYGNQEFAFRVSLIPKTINNIRKSDLAIEFIPLAECTSELLSENDKKVIAVKTIHKEFINTYYMKPSEICKKIQEKTGHNYTLNMHSVAWKKYNVRPSSNAVNKENTDLKYCIYDRAHNEYLYTDVWVNLLISELINNN